LSALSEFDPQPVTASAINKQQPGSKRFGQRQSWEFMDSLGGHRETIQATSVYRIAPAYLKPEAPLPDADLTCLDAAIAAYCGESPARSRRVVAVRSCPVRRKDGIAMQLVDLIPVLQTAIGPMILISGVGMLLLNMTNRLGRTIDRSRQLVELLKHCDEEERLRYKLQLDILWKRARILQSAIALIATSALLAALLVIALFFSVLLKFEAAIVLSTLFILCLSSLIGALVFFLRDINFTLHALALELGLDEKDRK
jgi:hypothetical protein